MTVGLRFIRAIADNSSSSGFFGVSDFRASTVDGGPDLMATIGGSPLESSHYPGLGAANAFDNNYNTDWTSDGGGVGQWVGWDFGFGNIVPVGHVYLSTRRGSFALAQIPSDISIQTSVDGVVWTPLVSRTGIPWVECDGTSATAQRFDIGSGPTPPTPPPSYPQRRFWRLRARANLGTPGQTGLAELQLYTSIGGANVAPTGTPIGDTGSGARANAFDNNAATNWQVSGDFDKTIGVDFGVGVEVDVVQFGIAPHSASYQYTPFQADLECSVDGVVWEFRFGLSTFWTAPDIGTVRRFTPPAIGVTIPHRGWRVRALSNNNGGGKLISLGMVQLRATPGGATQDCNSDYSTASGYFGAFTPKSAFDASYDSFWASSPDITYPWVAADALNSPVGGPIVVTEVGAWARTDGDAIGQSAAKMCVDYSDDMIVWRRAGERNDIVWLQSNSAPSTEQIFTLVDPIPPTPSLRRRMVLLP